MEAGEVIAARSQSLSLIIHSVKLFSFLKMLYSVNKQHVQTIKHKRKV